LRVAFQEIDIEADNRKNKSRLINMLVTKTTSKWLIGLEQLYEFNKQKKREERGKK